MSLKTFLQEKGFIEKETKADSNAKETRTESNASAKTEVVEPTYFPLQDTDPGGKASSYAEPNKPATDLQTGGKEAIDEAFIKFFEDELTKTNFQGPDYFEFRKQMLAMHQKIGKKGTPPEVILQAVLTSFEAQNISASKLIETAKQYRAILDKKKMDFLAGAAAEKDKQVQKRKSALQSHQDNLNKMQGQLLQLQNQVNLLQEAIKKEQAQMEADKTLGKEGIEKIEKAEKQISLAHGFICASIEADITELQSA
jgi:hypothetical protein